MHFACRHIMHSGVRCQAPAMRQSHFCYYHSKNRSRARLDRLQDLIIPIPEDNASIRTSVTQTVNALISKHIDAKTAGLVLYGLQLAAQSLPKSLYLAPDSVRETEQSAEGDELAPVACVRPARHDCSGCSRVDTCPHRVFESDEDEEDQGDNESEDEKSETGEVTEYEDDSDNDEVGAPGPSHLGTGDAMREGPRLRRIDPSHLRTGNVPPPIEQAGQMVAEADPVTLVKAWMLLDALPEDA